VNSKNGTGYQVTRFFIGTIKTAIFSSFSLLDPHFLVKSIRLLLKPNNKKVLTNLSNKKSISTIMNKPQSQGKLAFTDQYFMRMALQEAEQAYLAGEVPVGAIIVSQNQVIAKAHNQVEKLQDATAHAEMIALSAAFSAIGGKYLTHCTLYVTLEPCLMCSHATYWAQLSKLVFGAYDPKRGYSLVDPNPLHPRTVVKTNVLGLESQTLLQSFFVNLRS